MSKKGVSEYWEQNPKIRKKVIVFTYALLLTALIPLFCGGQVDYIIVFLFLFTATSLIEMIINHAVPFHLTLLLVCVVGVIGYYRFSWSVWTVLVCLSMYPIVGMLSFTVCNPKSGSSNPGALPASTTPKAE